MRSPRSINASSIEVTQSTATQRDSEAKRREIVETCTKSRQLVTESLELIAEASRLIAKR